jgi:hypothetical protein
MAQVVVVRDVPANRVDDLIEGFKNAGATTVTKRKQADGKYTLRATFPD